MPHSVAYVDPCVVCCNALLAAWICAYCCAPRTPLVRVGVGASGDDNGIGSEVVNEGDCGSHTLPLLAIEACAIERDS
jgi:hypothetical protein